MKKYLVLPAFLLLAASAWAADLNGKWIAQISNNNGSITERTFNFNDAAGKLSGTVVNHAVAPATFEEPGKAIMSGTLKTQQGKPLEIVEGQVTGDDVTFTVMGNMFGTPVKTVYTGKVSGSEISLATETKIPEGLKSPSGSPVNPPRPQQMVAKRAGK